MPSRLAIVVPCAADSPWIEPLRPHLAGAGAVYVVSESGGDVAVEAEAGFAERANAGVAQAAADGFERVLLLNDDTEPQPGALRALAEAPGIAAAVLLDYEGDGVQQSGIDVRRSGRIRARRDRPTQDRTVDAASGAALAFPVATWRRLGGFDEGYTFYFEDIDFCLRSGEPVTVLAAAVVRHRGGGTRSHRSPDAAFHLGRSHARFVTRLGGPATAARLGIVAAAGAAWTVRSVGLRGLGPLFRGLAEGRSQA